MFSPLIHPLPSEREEVCASEEEAQRKINGPLKKGFIRLNIQKAELDVLFDGEIILIFKLF